MTNTPDPLDELIASWKEVPSGAADLRRRVWARIDATEKNRGGMLQAWRNTVGAMLRQRAVLGWVAACIALGLISAELRATRMPVRDITHMAAVYLQTINPLLRDSAGTRP